MFETHCLVTTAKRCVFFQLLVVVMALLMVSCDVASRRSEAYSLIETIVDMKDFKKLLRTKNNVLVFFGKSARESTEVLRLCAEVADEIRGQATLAFVDCGGEGKKFCKKLKISPESAALKHYKDGEFHKDYDRKLTIQSMVNFLKDPSGDVPWEEDGTAENIVHIADPDALWKLLHKERGSVMMMFYAPWCGFCKKLKPEYAAAATELMGHSVLAAMDVNKPENSVVRRHYNVSAFPTLLYFENGNLKYKYEGENSKESIVNFLKNPGKQQEKPKELEWSEVPSDIVHLTDASFNSVIAKEPAALVMFYAPWCGHCKKMKPEFTNAATRLKQQNVPGILAAVDATKEKGLAERFKLSGYPTVKYFKNGEFAFDVNLRTVDKIEEFMKDPKEPPPPPAPELPWSAIPSDVVHLDEESFRPFLRRKKNVLVMFYAPWCGHCKKAKPEFQAAAEQFRNDPKVEFAAVDCTQYSELCTANGVHGYPTIKYFSYHKTSRLYESGRLEADFVAFMKDPQGKTPSTQPIVSNPSQWWSNMPGAEDLHHLTDEMFDDFLGEHDSVLVMFYAPWCGHCQAMKAAFAEAAAVLKNENISGVLATVDATVERTSADNYGIKGFPTVKFFWKKQEIAKYDQKRTVTDLVNFMKNPPVPKDEL